jgi:predicted Fe-Mo cluster-binding NifX family protein
MRSYHDPGRIGKKEEPGIIPMKNRKIFAVPTVNRILTPHFGHCEHFAIVKTEDNDILSTDFIEPPMHQPGVYPGFLAGQGVDIIISGGMGMRAQDLFTQHGIEVCIGVSGGSPEGLVKEYLDNVLKTGENLCDH